ncbi:hypothetical protein UFOVP451_43 [uncultured Caudovirales phage]|uniref:Uncharacterized protein n=1 Tax=uncultured Caudovirales phage TaxID=2100421 RepID=A0A6J5MCN8_9CAUD|nr:hypothetical protein UFOVP451_43 [uncultured Caudovirales phage]
MEQPIKSWSYKGYTIELYRSGWYSALTVNGYVKADTLQGVKNF